MRVTVIRIIVGTLEKVLKGLVKGQQASEIRERIESIQTTELLRSAGILRRVLKT